MTTQHYKRLEDGAMDDIDAAIWSGDIFHNIHKRTRSRSGISGS